MKAEEIKELIRIFGKSKLDKLQIKQKDFEIEMHKSTEPSPISPVTQALDETMFTSPATNAKKSTSTKKKKQIEGEIVASPLVGLFYTSASSDSSPFVEIGDEVRKGDVLCILEAMHTMNELRANYDCKILDILVDNGDTVEYDQALFAVEKI